MQTQWRAAMNQSIAEQEQQQQQPEKKFNENVGLYFDRRQSAFCQVLRLATIYGGALFRRHLLRAFIYTRA